MSLHAGQVKMFLRGQIIIAKVTLERALYIHGINIIDPIEYQLGPKSFSTYTAIILLEQQQ